MKTADKTQKRKLISKSPNTFKLNEIFRKSTFPKHISRGLTQLLMFNQLRFRLHFTMLISGGSLKGKSGISVLGEGSQVRSRGSPNKSSLAILTSLRLNISWSTWVFLLETSVSASCLWRCICVSGDALPSIFVCTICDRQHHNPLLILAQLKHLLRNCAQIRQQINLPASH